MGGHRKWSELRDEELLRPGAAERMAEIRAATEIEIREYEARYQAALALVESTRMVVVPLSEAEDTEDVSLQAVEEYLDFIGASLEPVAVFDDG